MMKKHLLKIKSCKNLYYRRTQTRRLHAFASDNCSIYLHYDITSPLLGPISQNQVVIQKRKQW